MIPLLAIQNLANSIGNSGEFELEVVTSNNASAGAKTVRAGLNRLDREASKTNTNVQFNSLDLSITPLGNSNWQYAIGTGIDPHQVFNNLAQTWTVFVSGQLANANDWLTIEFYKVRRRFGA